MKPYEVLLEPAAQRDLGRIRSTKLEAVQKALAELAQMPLGPKTEMLKASLRLNRNDAAKPHRIIFEIKPNKKIVRVLRLRDLQRADTKS